MSATAFSLIGRISMQGISESLKSVEGLEASVKAVSKELGKLGSTLTKTGSYLTKNLTAPLGAATAAIGLLSVKTGEYAGKLSSLQQETGLTTDTLQEYQHVARAAGGSSDALFATITQLSNKLPDIAQGTGKSAEALDKLGIRVTNADGSFRDMNDLFPEIISKLQGIDDITTRNQIAFDVFGKKSREVASFLGMTSEEMSKTRKEAHDLGLVMKEDSLKAADDFRKGMETLKAQFASVGMEIGNKVIPILNETFIPLIQSTLIPTLKTATDVVGGLASAFSAMPKDLQEVTFLMGGVAMAAGPVALIIGKIALSIKTVIPVMAGLGVKLGAVSAGATGAGAAVAGFATAILLPLAALASLGNLIRVAIRDFGTLARLKKEAKEDDAFVNEAQSLAKTTAEARLLKEEYAKLKDKPDFNPAELERLTTAYEDAAIAHRNLNKERAGQGKMTEEEVEAFRKKSRGIKEVSAEEAQMTEFAMAQTNVRKKAYAEEAIARKKELDGIVTDYEDKYDRMMMNEAELIDYEEAKELKRLQTLKATEEQIYVVHTYYNEQRQKLVDADSVKEAEAAEEAIKEEKKKVEKIAEINKGWQSKVLQQSGDKLKILQTEYADELAKVAEQGANLNAVHEYYIGEEIKLRRELAAEEARIEKETSAKTKKEFEDRLSTVGQWVGAVASMVGSLGKVFSQYAENQEKVLDKGFKERKKNEEKEFDERKKRIEADAQNNIITETQKNDQLKALEAEKTEQLKAMDEEHEAAKLAIQKEQAKRQKAISLFTIVTDTATAVMKAIKDFGVIAGGIMGGIITGLGATQFALVAGQPEPFALGGLVKGSEEGIVAKIGEGGKGKDEVVMPLQTGIDKIVDGLNASHSGSNTTNYTVNVNVGSFIGDRRGIQELGRKIREVIINENMRVGVANATA